MDTAAHCEEDGLTFLPMVMEGHGGSWGAEARSVWNELAKSIALATHQPVAGVAEHLVQSLSVILQRENARAVLRRAPQTTHALHNGASQARAAISGAGPDAATNAC